MAPWLGAEFGNASSLHAHGRRSKAALDEARERVAGALGCEFGEVAFTSGGTEAANLALIGTALGSGRRRILLSGAEHHCVIGAVPTLERLGFAVELLPVDRFARIDMDALSAALDDDVLLVAAMHANNELGTWNPVREVADLTHRHGAFYFCDAVQSFLVGGWSVDDLGADLISVSAHKVGGPKGTGALYVRAGTPIRPLVVGGGQEREVRGGTENVAGIVGFGAAVAEGWSDGSRRRAAKAAFAESLADARPTVPEDIPTHPGIFHCRIPGVDAETMLIRLDRAGISAGSGAACSSGSIEPSHVLQAAGYSKAEAREGLRFSFGDETSIEDARAAAALVDEAVSGVLAARSR